MVKLMTMRSDFYFSTVYSITGRGAVIYYEGLVYMVLLRLDAYLCLLTNTVYWVNINLIGMNVA